MAGQTKKRATGWLAAVAAYPFSFA